MGIIFDLDGVLTDTEEFHFRSWQRLADELGLPFSRESADKLRGRSREDALEQFLAGRPGQFQRGERGEFERSMLLERKNDYFLELIENLGPGNLQPGVLELLESARLRGVRLGLASSSRNAWNVCLRLGILQSFEAFADGNCGLRPKPAPDIFLWVAGRLDLRPAHCVIVEDAEAGVEAGVAGGFTVVGVGPPERVGSAHLVRPDLSALSLDRILQAAAPSGAAA